MKRKIDRIYHHYEKWEDYLNGMYATPNRKDEHYLIQKSRELLSDKERLYLKMKEVTEKWIFASEQNLSNTSMNRQAWLGQASCCLCAGSQDSLTIIAWNQLEEIQRIEANKVADRVISEWEDGEKGEVQKCLNDTWE